MASAFTRLFLPSHRKSASTSNSARRHEATRPRFPTSSTFDLRHSIPEESASSTDAAFPALPSATSLTVHHLNRHVGPPITDATLRRNSLALEPVHARPALPRSFSAYDITVPPDQDPVPSSRTPPPPPVDDDDDLDTNPLFLRLSEDEASATDWARTTLVVVPLARSLAVHHEIEAHDLADPAFVALHAFAASKLYKHHYVSVRAASQSPADESSGADRHDWSCITLTATLDAEKRSVIVTESPAGTTFTHAILGETTLYRSTSDAVAATAKVRVISVDRPIVHRRPSVAIVAAPTAVEVDDADAGISQLILRHVARERVFSSDLALVSHPCTGSFRLDEALASALQVLVGAAHQFAASFVYVRGFDSYNAHRIRRGIWFKAWKAFEERLGSEHVARLGVEAFHRIKSLLESVVMGLVHTKMYAPIQDQLLDADLVIDDVLAAYAAANTTLAELGVLNPALRTRPDRLIPAIEALAKGLADDGGSEIDDALATADVEQIRQLTSAQAPAVRLNDLDIDPGTGAESGASLHRRTPLQVLQTLRAVIDEVGWAAERVQQTTRGAVSEALVGADDLLPILSYVFVRARPGRLGSMLYYTRAFQLTDTATSPDLQWALVTCDAVITYLRTDPLRLCRRRSSLTLADAMRRSPSKSAASEALFARSMSSRSHHGSAAGSSLTPGTAMARSPSGPSGPSGSGSNYMSPPPSPRSPLPEMDEARLGKARPASVFSLDDDEASLDWGRVVGGTSPRRERTLSSSSSTGGGELQIRPQIVRTIKRSYTGRLERSGSSGSTSSTGIHVRVVGSSALPRDDKREDRRRSIDSWSFSLFPPTTAHVPSSAPRRKSLVTIVGGVGPEFDVNCQPMGVESPLQPTTLPSSTQLSSAQDKAKSARIRSRLLSTSIPLPPQVDRNSTTAPSSATPSRASLNALRASISPSSPPPP